MRLQRCWNVIVALGLVVIGGAGFPSAGAAQVKLELTPYFASYFPAGRTRAVATNDQERQAAGPGAGVRLEYRFTQMLSFEGSGTYIFSGIIPRDPGFAEQPKSGAVILAS